MYGIGKIFNNPYKGLIFALLCGLGYYGIVFYFILQFTSAGGILLAFFCFPAVVAGCALVIFKMVKNLTENEEFKKINIFLWSQVVLFLISLVFWASIILM